MSLLSVTCAALLHAGTPPCAMPDAAPFAVAVSETELASIRGKALPIVGLAQAQAASDASADSIGSFGPDVADTAREVTDNWMVNVAAPLIAAATAAAR